MNVLVVDDEQYMLDDVVSMLEKMDEVQNIFSYTDPMEGLECGEIDRVHVALLDIKMYGIHGIEMAKRLKERNPKIRIIFLTGYSNYMQDAFKIHANGYLMKPTTGEEIEEELRYVRQELDISPRSKCSIRVQTFGNFEVFYQEKSLDFHSEKAKELLAYLVDRRGSKVTIAEIAENLWEDSDNDKNAKSYVRRAISRLIEVLEDHHCEHIITKSRNNIGIIPEEIDCDYYRFLEGDISAINAYLGEYMANYSWAEFTTGYLDARK